MDEFIIDGTKLRLLKNKKELSFDFTIRTVLHIENVYIVLLLIPSGVNYERNVFGINNDGVILWQVDALPFYPGGSKNCHYSKIHNENNKLTLLNWCSFYFIVDPYTGKVLERGETR